MQRLYNGNGSLENIATVMGLVALKSVIRYAFSKLPLKSHETRLRLMFLLEHTFFTVYGWYVLVIVPPRHNVQSWFLNTLNNWTLPIFPFELFHFYYQLKLASHVEDLLTMGWSWRVGSAGSPAELAEPSDARNDKKMVVHHITTAALCLGSYFTGYVKIGSLVMLLHDASDVPLDLLRLATTYNNDVLSLIFYFSTLAAWVYWRLWFLPFKVMRSIAIEAKSLVFDLPCAPGECTWSEYPLNSFIERVPFLLLLGSLFCLHVLWFRLLIKKGLNFFRKPSKSN